MWSANYWLDALEGWTPHSLRDSRATCNCYLPLQLYGELHHPELPCRSTAGSCNRWGRWFSWRHLSDASVPHQWLEEEKRSNDHQTHQLGFALNKKTKQWINHNLISIYATLPYFPESTDLDCALDERTQIVWTDFYGQLDVYHTHRHHQQTAHHCCGGNKVITVHMTAWS